jgi:S-adenosylmethionine:tRNA ribosyltransferase-isomerase
MHINDFDFNLPQELIAQYPLAKRSASRLLCVSRKSGLIEHRQFVDLPELLFPNDLLVFNDTKVVPARLFGTKPTGGRVEVLIERILERDIISAQIRASKSLKVGSIIYLNEQVIFTILSKEDDFFILQSSHSIDFVLQQFGHIPLPPYIGREDNALDRERYQTIYAEKSGAVAAPTAGLHFDNAMFTALAAKGIQSTFLTLHVGAGTFQPVRVQDITQHKMHLEYVEVSPQICELVKATKASGGRVIAVGTTSVRSLETAALHNGIQPFCGDSDIFIYPGFRFRCVDGIITNFHLPKSTLLMLVSAFAGLQNVRRAYQEAIQARYRFYSYGDAMFLRP